MADPAFLDSVAVDSLLAWAPLVAALEAGHRLPRAEIGDLLLRKGVGAMLNRAAWIEGLGLGLKTVSVFPANPGKTPPYPTVQGVFVLFDAENGSVQAVIDGASLTRWKTAGDSLLGARFLARPDARRLLVAGAGVIAEQLVVAYGAAFPELESILLWSRSRDSAADLVARLAPSCAGPGRPALAVAENLPAAAAQADIVACATSAQQPFLDGAWIAPGTHVDLIGAFTPDMREANDTLIRRGRIFVDARETTLHEIGELKIPLDTGVIAEADVVADLYDLAQGTEGRRAADDITVFKNGGGAHLDLMTAAEILRRHRASARSGQVDSI